MCVHMHVSCANVFAKDQKDGKGAKEYKSKYLCMDQVFCSLINLYLLYYISPKIHKNNILKLNQSAKLTD